MESMSQFATKEDLYEARCNRLQMENAALLHLLNEIGNELFMAADDGTFYADNGDSPFMHSLADKLNKLLI